MLQINDLETGYGKKQVLFGLSMAAPKERIVAIIGPNGSGKSTILKAVCGLIPAWQGDIVFDGVPVNGSTVARNIARGISFAPQGNRVFDDLTVMENLEIGAFQVASSERKVRIAEMLDMFPALAGRLRQEAGRLSGGEQQMLALARALIPRPKLLMLDEPSLGLSPSVLKDVFGQIARINQDAGVTMLIVEQKVREVLEICHEVYSIKLGRVAFRGDPGELKGNKEKLRQLFL